jgi:hypothetical protein
MKAFFETALYSRSGQEYFHKLNAYRLQIKYASDISNFKYVTKSLIGEIESLY